MTIAVEANPTLARRRLAVFFRRLRERQGLGLDELAKILGVDPSFASRLDTGARGFRIQDIPPLCRFYGLDATEERRLTDLVEESRKRAWWQQIDLPDAVRTFIGMEQAAVGISEFATQVVPGLLQTEDYASALAETASSQASPQRLAGLRVARIRRQEILRRERPPHLHVVIDEAVLARVAGGPSVMAEQLRRLVDAGRSDQIVIQVIGFERGVYPAWMLHFQVLDMGEELPDVLYSEDLLERYDTTDAGKICTARELWNSLTAAALSPEESITRIEQYADRLVQDPQL